MIDNLKVVYIYNIYIQARVSQGELSFQRGQCKRDWFDGDGFDRDKFDGDSFGKVKLDSGYFGIAINLVGISSTKASWVEVSLAEVSVREV